MFAMWTGSILLSWLIWFVGGVVLVIMLGRFFLPLLIRLHVGQTIRAEGPQKHLTKAGTPTMGGLIFVVAMIILFFFRTGAEPYHWLWLFSFLAFGLIGFLDDIFKVVFHRNLGLNGKQKLLGQFIAVFLLLLGNELLCNRGTGIYLPSAVLNGIATPWFDLGWFYYPLVAVLVVGMVNAVNLTDGLDGLAAGVSIPVFIGFMSVSVGIAATFGYGEDLSVYSAALAGCCLGFLYYNHYPARVFMGDTGSMVLGGAVVGMAVVLRMELLLFGFGLLYLVEACSVILQVISFKLTSKRIFLMSPLHHHFELKGWPETRVTSVFCLCSAVFVFVTLLLCAIL